MGKHLHLNLPSFFIVGPPRTGTSWLHEIFKNYAILPNPKETRFFDLHFELGTEWYLRHFSESTTTMLVGEVAPTYFSSAAARTRIAKAVPGAKVVCIFRDPVERIVSLYKLKRSLGMISWSLEEALFRDKELLESSKYASHLREWQSLLGEKQVLPTLYDNLCDNPQRYVDSVADFVGLGRFTLPSSPVERVHASERLTHPRWHAITHNATCMAEWLKRKRFHRLVDSVRGSIVGTLLQRSGASFEEVSPDLSRAVYSSLSRELDELEARLGWKLSHWRPSSLKEGDSKIQAA